MVPSTVKLPPILTLPAKVDSPSPFTVRTPAIIASPFCLTSNKGVAAESTTENTFTKLPPSAVLRTGLTT